MVIDIAIGAGGFGFDFLAGLIGDTVIDDSPVSTVATFLRSCVVPALYRGDGLCHSSHALACNVASVMKI